MPGAPDVDEAIGYLKTTSTTTGDSVYDHLSRLIQRILEDRPSDAVDLLEESLLVKKTKFKPSDPSDLVAPAVLPKDHSHPIAILELFATPEPVIDVETGEPEEAEPLNDYETENLLADSSLYESVGVGLGRAEVFFVALAIKKLGENPKYNIRTIRFFGKIFGIFRNYYVFETTSDVGGGGEEDEDEDDLGLGGGGGGEGEEEEEEIDEEEIERRKAERKANKEWGRPQGGAPPEVGSGTNAFIYYVCNHLGGPFTKLPDVTPLQIKTARTLKKFLTGDLKAEVMAYPQFPGVEENYLRAQIARIAATTVICPVGVFNVNEEDEEGLTLEKNEEYEMPENLSDLANLEAWVHRYPHIKMQGRCVVHIEEPPEPEENEEEEEEEEKEPPPPSPEELEEGPPLLSQLENDDPLATGEQAWSVGMSSLIPSLKYRAIWIRSLLWPGAYAIATPSGGVSNIYVGWGLKNAPFVPLPPPDVGKEYDGSLVESSELPPRPENVEEGEGEEEEEEEDSDIEGGEEEEEEDG